jgi:signal transduction histidine kinase
MAVSDTGPGIAPADLERIYEPFWQAEEPLTRHAGGTGLGLSVSMRLAQLLGGTLTAESRPGHGSTFILRVPARMPGAAPRP